MSSRTKSTFRKTSVVCTYIILGECLLISSLPGEPGKFDIKRHEPGILFISLPS